MEQTYLMHYGKKDMKWGVRRYQNKDGTLTEAGKRRYARDKRENDAKKKDNRIIIDENNPDVNRWVKEDITRSKAAVDSVSSMNKQMQKVSDDVYTNVNKSKKRMDLSNMSDKDMRDKINRELLERQYDDIFSEKKASKGKAFIDGALNAIGTTLTIASTSLAIALAIKELKG